ncbi:cytochrome b [Blastochloris viridis]|uniref:Cytochrome B561 n=1 Tax=Blastochloris viridis TaxID=1079 RepID=A0A182D6F5_BLAVI|nr:cytochrome b/b6 domain-containing protein [Blastochloris viridis]BAS00744.1 cytochrome B561 [Blastochloris viridis]
MVVGLFTSAQIAEGVGDQIKQLQALASDPAVAEQIKGLMADRGNLMGVHKAIGVVVFGLVVLRLVARLAIGVPEPVSGSPILGLLAKAAHGLLYVLLIVMPASGFLMSMYAGRGVDLLGIPPLLEKNIELAKQFGAIHGLTMNVILLVVLFHAAAALWHHYVQKDETLGRMVPWLRRA